MARRGGGGGKKGSDNLIATVAGGIGAVMLDYMAYSVRAPGYKDTIYKITPARGGLVTNFSTLDYIQMGLTTALGSFGFSQGSGSRIPAFAWGMLLTQIITKIGFPSLGLPRYILFDIDSTGALVPVRKF